MAETKLWENSERFADSRERGYRLDINPAGTVKRDIQHDPIGFRFFNYLGNYIGEIVEFDGHLCLKFYSAASERIVYPRLAGVEVTGRTIRFERNRADIKARVIFAGGDGFQGGVCDGWIH